jgi:hypothetical protein
MARVFTVNVSYKGQRCAALVSFDCETYNMSFLVRYLDDEIQQLIPGRKVVVSLSEGIKSPKELSPVAEQLLNLTTEAISDHLSHHHQ